MRITTPEELALLAQIEAAATKLAALHMERDDVEGTAADRLAAFSHVASVYLRSAEKTDVACDFLAFLLEDVYEELREQLEKTRDRLSQEAMP